MTPQHSFLDIRHLTIFFQHHFENPTFLLESGQRSSYFYRKIVGRRKFRNECSDFTKKTTRAEKRKETEMNENPVNLQCSQAKPLPSTSQKFFVKQEPDDDDVVFVCNVENEHESSENLQASLLSIF